jgi:dienelactone hydrolase
MRFLFKDKSFSFEALRAAGFANYGGADLSDILVTARTIKDGDEASWLGSWKATAQRVHAVADQALAQDHRVSAREAFLRASNYYRTAEFFQRVNPAEDPEVALLSGLSRKTFRAAMNLLDSPVEEVAIPYGGSTLPGYLFLVDASGRPRPTIIYNNGFDSTSEESYFAIAAAALLRGYNVVAFDGPGQGAALRVQRLVFRHDWEAVVTPVIDFALMRPEILPESIVLFGYSFGGYLVARAAAFDHRPAAIILDDGLFDYSVSGSRAMPRFLFRWIMEGRDSLASPLLRAAAAMSTQS